MFGKKVTTIDALMPGLNKMSADLGDLWRFKERTRDRLAKIEKALEEQANDHRRHEHYMYEDGGVGLPMYPAKPPAPASSDSGADVVRKLSSKVVELQNQYIKDGWTILEAGERNLELMDKVKALQEEIARLKEVRDELRGQGDA